MPKRIYINKSVHELESIYKENRADENTLLALVNELSHRKTSKANSLKQDIVNYVSGDAVKKLSKNQRRKFLRGYYSAKKENELIDVIKANTKYLSNKEKKILELRISGLTLEEIGSNFDVTRERIRQILVKIKKKGFDVPRTASIVKKASAAEKNKQIIEDQVKTNSDYFIKEYRKNLSDKDTAKNLELSLKNFRTVVEIFIKEGLMNRRLKIFDEKQYIEMKKEWDEIAAMRKAGYSNQKIASILGTSTQMISIKIERMKSNGYHIRPYGFMADRDYSNDHDEETLAYRTQAIKELNNEGLSKSQIAKKLGIGSRDLYRHISLYMIDY